MLGTRRNSGCLSPCLGWSSNSRRAVAFSPPLLRATDPSLTDREGNVQMEWTGAICPLRGSIQQLTQTDADIHSQTEDGAWGLLWKDRRKNCGLRRGQELHRKTNRVN